MKRFTTSRDALDYLRNKAKEGEEIVLDERASVIHPGRVHYFKRQKRKAGVCEG
jgi:hypothetical protein